jgi:hypothetical protein
MKSGDILHTRNNVVAWGVDIKNNTLTDVLGMLPKNNIVIYISTLDKIYYRVISSFGIIYINKSALQ